MKSRSPLLPALATALLHAALITLAIVGLSSVRKNSMPPKPIHVQLLQEPSTPQEPLPAAPIEPPQQPRHKKQKSKPLASPKPTPQPREHVTAPTRMPAAPAAAPPMNSNTNATPTSPQPNSVAPSATASASPIKHGVFVDPTYLATETEKWYPRQSKRYEDEGTVLLHVTVSAAGRAEKVELRKGSGFPLLDEAAVGLAKSITYRPATLDGKPVADSFNMPVTFKLHD